MEAKQTLIDDMGAKQMTVNDMDIKQTIIEGRTSLGIEFGSTRIKAVLIDMQGTVLAVGFYDWENSLVNGIWTYAYEEIARGLQGCYTSLRENIEEKYGITPKRFGAIGISAMMHGYIAVDANGSELAPFQTWRNSNTQQAADELTGLLEFNIPLRWTIAHLYQCILDQEEHVAHLDFVTTLSSYIHWKLTGQKVIGIGDASGIFPIDSEVLDYDPAMMARFNDLIAKYHFPWKTEDVLPQVLLAGDPAGRLTQEGAAFLDVSGNLEAGIPMCPPEGDAGTGMTATNAVRERTGNVSAGTSTFAMLVLEKKLSGVYREIDMVTTPTGRPVAMSHANNGTSDLNAWVNIFKEFSELMGYPVDMGELYGKLYTNSLKGDPDCGGLLSYGYYSGEGVTHINEGRPLFARMPESRFNLANLMRVNLYTSLGAVKLGMDILLKQEHVAVDQITGHGGLFKTPGVAQRYLAAAVGAPVTVMENAGEGGPWGQALLAAYMLECTDSAPADEASDNQASGMASELKNGKLSLEDYLDQKIFAGMAGSTIAPDAADIEGFEAFTQHYTAGLDIERAAVSSMNW